LKKAVVSILQIVGFFIAFLAVTIAVMGLTKSFIFDWEAGGPRLDILGESLLTVLGIALTSLLIFGLAQSREVFRGWPGWRASLSGFGKGALLGFAMAGSMLILTVALGGGRLVLNTDAFNAYLPYVLSLGVCLLFAALAEEWLFRGYPLTRLSDACGRGWANLLMAFLFAAAHYGSTGFNSMTQINIVLGSLVLGALRFTSGGIPAAWGFHFVWNFTQVLCGANLSLEEIDVPGITFAGKGPTVLSGGAFGPEAGIGATIATIPVLVLLFFYFRRHGIQDLPIPLGRSGKATEDQPQEERSEL
jgi:membrane protease YdiL (CAAX protease family)